MIITLYKRDGCTLCQEAHYLLKWLAEQYPFEIQLQNINSDPELQYRFALEIPVVEANGEIIAVSKIDEYQIREYLDAYFSPKI